MRLVREECAASDLKLISLNLTHLQTPYIDCNINSEIPHVRDEANEFLCRSLHIAEVLEVDTIVIGSGVIAEKGQSSEQAYLALQKTLFDLGVRVGERGITILVEALPSHPYFRRLINTAKDIKDIINAVNLPNVAGALDLAHSSLMGEDPIKAIQLLGDLLQIVYIHDFASSIGPVSLDEHLLPSPQKLYSIAKTLCQVHNLQAIVLNGYLDRHPLSALDELLSTIITEKGA